jgi:hypothetical protein
MVSGGPQSLVRPSEQVRIRFESAELGDVHFRNSCVAGGYVDSGQLPAPLVIVWDGAVWSIVSSPRVGRFVGWVAAEFATLAQNFAGGDPRIDPIDTF